MGQVRDELPEWVKPGTVLVPVNSHISGVSYGLPCKIAKVYKNGNFVTDAEAGSWAGQWRSADNYATRAGDRWSIGSLYPLTPELQAEIDKASAVSEARRVVRAEADRLQRLRDPDELLAAAEAIRARGAA